jgi:hypothetical protein
MYRQVEVRDEEQVRDARDPHAVQDLPRRVEAVEHRSAWSR